MNGQIYFIVHNVYAIYQLNSRLNKKYNFTQSIKQTYSNLDYLCRKLE